jgi:hypothetical protein
MGPSRAGCGSGSDHRSGDRDDRLLGATSGAQGLAPLVLTAAQAALTSVVFNMRLPRGSDGSGARTRSHWFRIRSTHHCSASAPTERSAEGTSTLVRAGSARGASGCVRR